MAVRNLSHLISLLALRGEIIHTLECIFLGLRLGEPSTKAAEEAMKNAKTDIDFAAAQSEFAAMAAQLAALRKFRGNK